MTFRQDLLMNLSPLNHSTRCVSQDLATPATPATPDVMDSLSLCLEQQHPLVSSYLSDNNYATLPSHASNLQTVKGERFTSMLYKYRFYLQIK